MGQRSAASCVRRAILAVLVVAALLVSVSASLSPRGAGIPGWRIASSAAAPTGIQKIRHVVVIMQENRSFDSYFGTFPGAEGIPMQNGRPSVCVPDPRRRTCQRPYVNHKDSQGGGPHGPNSERLDVHGAKMNG